MLFDNGGKRRACYACLADGLIEPGTCVDGVRNGTIPAWDMAWDMQGEGSRFSGVQGFGLFRVWVSHSKRGGTRMGSGEKQPPAASPELCQVCRWFSSRRCLHICHQHVACPRPAPPCPVRCLALAVTYAILTTIKMNPDMCNAFYAYLDSFDTTYVDGAVLSWNAISPWPMPPAAVSILSVVFNCDAPASRRRSRALLEATGTVSVTADVTFPSGASSTDVSNNRDDFFNGLDQVIAR